MCTPVLVCTLSSLLKKIDQHESRGMRPCGVGMERLDTIKHVKISKFWLSHANTASGFRTHFNLPLKIRPTSIRGVMDRVKPVERAQSTSNPLVTRWVKQKISKIWLRSTCPPVGSGQVIVPKPNFTQFSVFCRIVPHRAF